MNNLSRIGAQGSSHSKTQLGNVKLVSRVAMRVVTGCLLLFAGGCNAPDDTLSKAETPNEPCDQELERIVFWGPLPEKTLGNLKYKEHPTEPVCAISGVVDDDAKTGILPAQIEGRVVVRIGEGAFACCHSLKSVTIPSGVTSIGDHAFFICDSLTSVTIPSSVTHIGEQAFWNCDSLISVTIPSSVTHIGDRAFDSWEKLGNISVAMDNPSYQAEGGVLFTKDGKTLVQYPRAKAGKTYTIPDSVTRIAYRAFSDCLGLASVTIPSSVTSIGDMTFEECTALRSVTIPSSVTGIGEKAFCGCLGLTSVTIPSSVTSIGDGAFMFCDGLKSVTISSSVTSIGAYAFSDCKALTSVTLPKGVKIGEDAFLRCPWQPTK
jgi:hypothetical protein